MEAKSFGLVERVAAKGDSLREAKKIAERILLRGPVAVAKAKKAINMGRNMALEEGLRLEARLFSELFETQDKKEGIAAFIEKRKPRFTGR
jgi:enoyl-CoA hydratase